MAGNLITDRVKQLVRMRGPLIPSQISKEIGTNILMASAILSELASKNEVKISNVKVGSTPLYYVPGQEQKLQNYLGGLHQKEREAYEQLKASGVLRDRSLEPVIRVALRQIKDFAKPIEVSSDGEVELFWKWYLLSNEEAEAVIKKAIGFKAEEAVPIKKTHEYIKPIIEPIVGGEEVTNVPAESKLQHTVQQLQQEVQQLLKTQQSQVQQAKPVQEAAAVEQTVQAAAQAQMKMQSEHLQPISTAVIKKMRKLALPKTTPTDFSKLVHEFFTKSNIEIESDTSQNYPKRTQNKYVVLIPSSVGKLRYYCVAQNKKTCTELDISAALVQGQLRKLPVLLLTKGELSKKAQEMLAQEREIGAILIKKI